jgi:hypothetical protein
MKKGTVNTILILGAAAAAFFIFTSMRRRRGSSVEAGPTIKQTETEFFEEAETAPAQPRVIETAKSVLDIFKELKRTPEEKAAAQEKRARRQAAAQEKRASRQAAAQTIRASRQATRKEKRAAKKVGEISILY